MSYTAFQQFIIDTLNEKKSDIYNANHIAYLWAKKNGKARTASRDMFGYTSNAYKALRKLSELGVVEKILTGPYNCENFRINQ